MRKQYFLSRFSAQPEINGTIKEIELPLRPEMELEKKTPEELLDELLTPSENNDESNPRKNRGFTQVYDKGWDTIDHLLKEYPLAGRVYAFLAKNSDSYAAIAVSQDVIAQALEVTDRSVRSATKYLSDKDILHRFRMGGGIYLYCLNPDEIWKSWETKKDYALFHCTTLIDKRKNADVIRRIKIMYQSKIQEVEKA